MTSRAAELKPIRPQRGGQLQFLSTPADIVLGGGQAGGSKTFSLLMEQTRHIHVPGFNAVIFRRTSPQITNEGGLWDSSMRLYPYLGLTPRPGDHEWVHPDSKASIRFTHLVHEHTVLDFQGAQICSVNFDELTHFTKYQFWYLHSRNRSECGVKPYMRATCNADADSWVAELVQWYINDDGYAIPERAGVLRWFVRDGDDLVWANTRDELWKRYEYDPDYEPISFTYIPFELSENVAFTKKDPQYRQRLLSLPTVERERLLRGNWKIRPSAGLVFDRAWFPVVDAAPANPEVRVRAWDFAGTSGGGDWTAGTRMSYAGGIYYIEDNARGQWGAGDRQAVVRQTAQLDGRATHIALQQDPGSAGKDVANATIGMLAGYQVSAETATGDKVFRANPFAAQAQAGNVRLVRGIWNEQYLGELHAFPTINVPDDDVDSSSLAFKKITDIRGTQWRTSRFKI